MTIEIIRNSEGDLRTTCDYQHGLAIDCNDCCNGELEAAYKRFKVAEDTRVMLENAIEHAKQYRHLLDAGYTQEQCDKEFAIVSIARKLGALGYSLSAPALMGTPERVLQGKQYALLLDSHKV